MLFCSLLLILESWLLQLVLDDCYCVFTAYSQQYKKLNRFPECQKFLIFWGTVTKILG